MEGAQFYEHTCACGCGKALEVRPCHRYSGIPRFAKGHLVRQNSAKTWTAAQQGRHERQCGCGGNIVVMPEHYWRGVPRYLNHHSTRVAMFHQLHSWTAGTSTTKHLSWKRRKFSFADKVRIMSSGAFAAARASSKPSSSTTSFRWLRAARPPQTTVRHSAASATTRSREATSRPRCAPRPRSARRTVHPASRSTSNDGHRQPA